MFVFIIMCPCGSKYFSFSFSLSQKIHLYVHISFIRNSVSWAKPEIRRKNCKQLSLNKILNESNLGVSQNKTTATDNVHWTFGGGGQTSGRYRTTTVAQI